MSRAAGCGAAAALLLAACGQGAPTAPTAPTQQAPRQQPPAPSGPVNPDPVVTAYVCPGGERLTAGYPDPQTAVVEYRGHAYTLKIARSASGARYAGLGLQWWTKGFEHGRLAHLKPGEEIASDPGVACEAEPVSPPAPGARGGLPDDRTPVSEAPFTAASAQGAANVVQTYFALLEQGRAGEAAAVRSDGKVFDLKPYASYHAQVGAPGKIEGAAGSLYVTVPIVIYGRFATGKPLHQSGDAVLRRVNNVPGATAEQLRWRIERLDIK